MVAAGTPSVAPGVATPGATQIDGRVNIAVVSQAAERIEVCLFDGRGDRETARLALPRIADDTFAGLLSGVPVGTRYGLRADGPDDPGAGHRFDPAKLLVDPYATALDRPFAWHPALAAERAAAIDTAPLVPKAIISAPSHPVVPANLGAPGFIYEISLRSFTHRHPDVPPALRGTAAALAAPAVIDHLVALGVDTVELMPIAAAIDERHLAPLGLTNAWGYNPVCFLAPDPRLAPGGLSEVRAAVKALHAAGIRVILDAVFNHTGEGDRLGPTLSLRGLDNALYYRHAPDGEPANDAGTGNTLAVERAPVTRLVLDAMRHWVQSTGIDGFRLDLAATLGRTEDGFRRDAPLFTAIESDPLLSRCTFIAEPWDVGPGGYQLGNFPPRWREWNDRFRDDIRRFWRGDPGTTGALATRLAGSSDIFAGRAPSASINFLAAHDGMTLADIVAYAGKHNTANGENNRDGTDANLSWNYGVEGETADPDILAARRNDVRALLATLFLARGTPMLTAGDEFGRSQRGNNNAYAQDNATTWLDWADADRDLITFVAELARLRKALPALSDDSFLSGAPPDASGIPDVVWLCPTGPMADSDWHENRSFGAALYTPATPDTPASRTAFWINGTDTPALPQLPPPRPGHAWRLRLDSTLPQREAPATDAPLPPRSVRIFVEEPASENDLPPVPGA